MLAILFVARTAMAFQFQTVASAGPVLVDAGVLDFTLLGTLIGLYMLPGAGLALAGGVMAQRYGEKRSVLWGLALMVLGGALMGSESTTMIIIGRVVSGSGAVFVNVTMTKMAADWFAEREIVTAMSIFIASWPLGIGIAVVAVPPFALAFG
jgi:MFS family permease